MSVLADLAVVVVAFLHLVFLVLEMFLWTKPIGRRVFGMPPDVMAASATLAANQGLYNGFLAAGLLWGVLLRDAGGPIQWFFLACVVIAGVFGGLTARRSILWIQALPGGVAMALVWFAGR